MKCPQCDGYGKVTYIVRSGNRIISKEVGECDYCYGTGEVNDWETESTVEPMTNEEWIKSLDTEGLVDYLYEVHKGGNSVERQGWIERHKEQVKMQFRGWLKEKHNAE